MPPNSCVVAIWGTMAVSDVHQPQTGERDSRGVDLVIEEARRLLDAQVETGDLLSSGLTGTFATGGAVIPVTIGLLNLGGTALPGLAKGLIIGAGLAYIAIIVCSVVAFWLPPPDFGPHPAALLAASERTEANSLRRLAAQTYVKTLEDNRARLQRRGRTVRVAIVFQYVEALLLGLAALNTVW